MEIICGIVVILVIITLAIIVTEYKGPWWSMVQYKTDKVID